MLNYACLITLLALIGKLLWAHVSYFAPVFLWTQVIVVSSVCLVGAIARSTSFLGNSLALLSAIEWLFGYGRSGFCLASYVAWLCAEFYAIRCKWQATNLVKGLFVGCGIFVFLRSNIDDSYVLAVLIYGLLQLPGSRSKDNSHWAVCQIILLPAVLLAVQIVLFEYRYYFSGVVESKILHPHLIGSLYLFIFLLGFNILKVQHSRITIIVTSILLVWLVLLMCDHFVGASFRSYIEGEADVVPIAWQGGVFGGILFLGLIVVDFIMIKDIVMFAVGIWSAILWGGPSPLLLVLFRGGGGTSLSYKRFLYIGLLGIILKSCFFWIETDSYHQAEPLNTELVTTLLAAEDIFFCDHNGIDWARLKWEVRDTLQRGYFKRGASTLTMQLVKVRHLSYDKSLLRKGLQMVGAIGYEVWFSKAEILKMYLSEISFGANIIGIDAAANHYFNKEVDALSSDEIRYLVATIENPAHFSPAVLPNVPEDVSKRLRHIKSLTREFNTYIKTACMASSVL
jgi:hypothetical protein